MLTLPVFLVFLGLAGAGLNFEEFRRSIGAHSFPGFMFVT